MPLPWPHSAPPSADVPNADRTLVADGFASLTTIVAYVLCRGWYTWRRGALGPDDNR